MTQRIERLLNSDDVQIFKATADTEMSGVAIEVAGIWYSQAELTQVLNTLTDLSAWLREEGVE